MDGGSEVLGLMFAAVARARREAVRRELVIHGFEDLEEAALPCLLDGEDLAPDPEEAARLLRVCRVVDGRLLAGFGAEELALLSAHLQRMLRNLRGDECFLT